MILSCFPTRTSVVINQFDSKMTHFINFVNFVPLQFWISDLWESTILTATIFTPPRWNIYCHNIFFFKTFLLSFQLISDWVWHIFAHIHTMSVYNFLPMYGIVLCAFWIVVCEKKIQPNRQFHLLTNVFQLAFCISLSLSLLIYFSFLLWNSFGFRFDYLLIFFGCCFYLLNILIHHL